MPQSLLAFLAMMIATSSALTQFAASNRVREEMMKSELEIMANAVALEAVELQAVPVGFDGLTQFSRLKENTYFTVENRSESFRKEWTVKYVDSSGNESQSPTDIREVTISVYHSRYTRPLVEHTRLIGQ